MITQKKATGKEVNERALAVGQRMKLAAEQAGYPTQVAMSEVLGRDQATVSRWWRGLQEPSLGDMEQYAEATGKRLWWFYVDGSDQEFDLVAESLMEIVNLAMAGRDLADSYEQVMGPDDRLNRRERARIAAGTAPVRERVTQEAEGDWQERPLRRRRQIVDRLAAEALRTPEE